VKPKRSGTEHPQICPTGVFRARDEYVILTAFLDHQWRALCDLMGCPELVEGPWFATNAARLEHRDEVVARIEGVARLDGEHEAAMGALRKARIPIAPVLPIEQAVNQPHYRAREPCGRSRTGPGRTACPLDGPVLGEHNAEVLSTYFDYDAGRIAALESGVSSYAASAEARASAGWVTRSVRRSGRRSRSAPRRSVLTKAVRYDRSLRENAVTLDNLNAASIPSAIPNARNSRSG
jgi:hypothetical protein